MIDMNQSELVKSFRAMGNERRFLILKHIFSKKELTVGEISKLINLSFKSVSRHLSVLKNANLVRSRQQNINNIYSINYDGLKAFAQFFKK